MLQTLNYSVCYQLIGDQAWIIQNLLYKQCNNIFTFLIINCDYIAWKTVKLQKNSSNIYTISLGGCLCKRYQTALRGRENFWVWWEISLKGDSFTRWHKSDKEWFWPFKSFLKLKTTFCFVNVDCQLKSKLAWPNIQRV